MSKLDPPGCACIECGRELYRRNMVETAICTACAQDMDDAAIEMTDDPATLWADWYEDEIPRFGRDAIKGGFL